MRARTLSLSLALALLSTVPVQAQTAPKYQPNWESLDQHEPPEWFENARFGIFIHWGVYSVPAWGPKGSYSEWYWNYLERRGGSPTREFHERNYGKDFKYADFAPLFRAELFDATEWARLFRRSGARYVVLTSKHHDGFCLWPSAESWNWNSVDAGPGRDLCGELTEAVRAEGIKMGFYYSLYEWFNPLYRNDLPRYVEEHMLPQMRDLCERYQPDLLWGDGQWSHPSEAWRTPEFLANLLNRLDGDIVINDRWGKETRFKHGDFYTSEYGAGFSGGTLWEECQGIGRSFGYNRNESLDEYRSGEELVRMLIDIVSRGGNLLLDIGPTADGRIPVIMQQRLVEMGEWLQVNGEAIYETQAGPFKYLPWGRATAKPERLYLHVFDWPSDGQLVVPGLKNRVTRARLLADGNEVEVESSSSGPRLTLPSHSPTPYAGVIVLEIEGEPEAENVIVPAADGTLELPAAMADIHGKTARLEGQGNIGYWSEKEDTVSWPVRVPPGSCEVEVEYAAVEEAAGNVFAVVLGGQRLQHRVKSTGGWQAYTREKVGRIQAEGAGEQRLEVRPVRVQGPGLMNLKRVILRPVKRMR